MARGFGKIQNCIGNNQFDMLYPKFLSNPNFLEKLNFLQKFSITIISKTTPEVRKLTYCALIK
jgi:hypothetical protein